MKNFLANVLGACVLVSAGCARGPEGATGPMGPSGPGNASPIYAYNQDFDGAGYSPASEFNIAVLNAGSLTLGLDGTLFVSAPESLEISTSAGVGVESGVFSKAGLISYVTGDDYYVDGYINYDQGSAAPFELQFYEAGSMRADLGLNPVTGHFYAYNNGTEIPFGYVTSNGLFTHINFVWHAKTGLSDYTINSTLLAQSLNCTQPTPSGAAATGLGLVFTASSDVNDIVLVDNLAVYHF